MYSLPCPVCVFAACVRRCSAQALLALIELPEDTDAAADDDDTDAGFAVEESAGYPTHARTHQAHSRARPAGTRQT